MIFELLHMYSYQRRLGTLLLGKVPELLSTTQKEIARSGMVPVRCLARHNMDGRGVQRYVGPFGSYCERARNSADEKALCWAFTALRESQ